MRLVHQQQPLIPIIVISGRPIVSDLAAARFPDHGDQARGRQQPAKAIRTGGLAGGRRGVS